MIVAVTGCNSFIGKNVIKNLIDAGHTVKGYDLFIPNDYPYKIEKFTGKLNNNLDLEKFCKNNDTIIHLMEIRPYENKPKSFKKKINITGTQNIVELALKYNVKNFIYLSSYEIYGKNHNIPIETTDKTRPQNVYGEQKLKGEKIVQKLTCESNIKTTIIRPALLIGAGTDNPIILISLFMAMGLGNDNKLYLIGDGDNRFQMIHPNDLSSAIILAMNSPISGDKIYNIGADEVPTQIEQLVKMKEIGKLDCSIKHISKFKTKFLSFILRPFNINYLSKEHLSFIFQNKLLDSSIAKDELEWEPTMTNLDILNELIAWYRKKYNAERF